MIVSDARVNPYSNETFPRRSAGEALPYATLMYVWSNRIPVGSVIGNPHTDRVHSIVVAVGVMTASDDTGQKARALYGDITFLPAP